MIPHPERLEIEASHHPLWGPQITVRCNACESVVLIVGDDRDDSKRSAVRLLAAVDCAQRRFILDGTWVGELVTDMSPVEGP